MGKVRLVGPKDKVSIDGNELNTSKIVSFHRKKNVWSETSV